MPVVIGLDGDQRVLRRFAPVLGSSVVVVIERFARQFAVLTRSGGYLSGEVGVGGCEMTQADELKARDALFGVGLRELALLLIAVGEQLRADVIDAGLAQVFEVNREAPALGQAVPAVADGVRARASRRSSRSRSAGASRSHEVGCSLVLRACTRSPIPRSCISARQSS
jgi:hypothetical protein